MNRRTLSAPALLFVIPTLAALACDDSGGTGQSPDARPADAAPADSSASTDTAPGNDTAGAGGTGDAAGDQAPAATLSPAKVLDHRILGATWLNGRWLAATYRDDVSQPELALQAFDLDGRPQERVIIARDVPALAGLATDGQRAAVTWMTQADATTYVIWLALVSDLAAAPQPLEIARFQQTGTITHGAHLALAWNGTAFGVLHGGQHGSELAITTLAGQVTGRVPGSASTYPGLFGRLVTGTDTGFALIESCPTLACLRLRTLRNDGTALAAHEIALGPDLTPPGVSLGAALTFNPTTGETAGAVAGARVLQFDGRGNTTQLFQTPTTEYRGRAVDAVFLNPGEGDLALHLAWTEGSRTIHRDGTGTVRSSPPDPMFRGNGPPNLTVLAPAPTALGLFTSREIACDACDPPPASAWYVRLAR